MPHTALPDPAAIGTLAWLRRSQGRLTLRERLRLMRLATVPAVRGMVSARWGQVLAGAPADLALAQRRLPDTPAVARALEAMADTGNTAVLQHSWRCHWWATALGQAERHQVDEEVLLVACLMHDLGIADRAGALASGCACFTGHSAEVAMRLTRQQGWIEARTLAVGEAITLHMNGHVDLAQGVEAHLLQQGTACDVIGARLAQLPGLYRQQVLDAHPRLDFDAQFTGFVAGQAREQPGSRAALMHRLGVGVMVAVGPY